MRCRASLTLLAAAILILSNCGDPPSAAGTAAGPQGSSAAADGLLFAGDAATAGTHPDAPAMDTSAVDASTTELAAALPADTTAVTGDAASADASNTDTSNTDSNSADSNSADSNSADSNSADSNSADSNNGDGQSAADIKPACQPASEVCNGKDDNCDGQTDEGLEDMVCGSGACWVQGPACVDGQPQTCEPLPPSSEDCNGQDDDCNGQTDEGLKILTCGSGACAVTVPSCVGGKPKGCTPKAVSKEVCNGIDDDCDGKTDEDSAPCAQGGQLCILGKCGSGCHLPTASPCPVATFCSVGASNVGQCLPAGSACLVTAPATACGNFVCGPGTLCHPQLLQCLADAPCEGSVCSANTCYGLNCSCQRPPPSCAAAALPAINAPSFSQGLVDIDMDLQCGLWGVTVISGTDYLRRLTPDGKVLVVNSDGNLNMNEVAALQGFGSVFGGNVVEAALTYGCCAACGCSSNPPKGVAWYDKATNTLPMMIATNSNLAGNGPFVDPAMAIHLNTGPTGLTWALSNQLYIGNVVENGDLHTVDLAVGKSKLLTKLPNRVYASAPFDGTRLAIALQGKQIVLVHTTDGQHTPLASPTAEVIALQRDPFTGWLMVALNTGQIRQFSSTGKDLGLFATAAVAGRITLGPDGWLYHVAPKVDAPASIVRWQLVEKL